jgi:hypothetical protein
MKTYPPNFLLNGLNVIHHNSIVLSGKSSTVIDGVWVECIQRLTLKRSRR